MSGKINTTMNDVFKHTPMGDRERVMGQVFYGHNHRKTPAAIPINTDDYGYTFFTRPQLNLNSKNIRSERKLYRLLTDDAAHIQRIIRCYLDPRLAVNNNITTPFVDAANVFMPLLSNHLVTLTGWPDPVLDLYTSEAGMYKENFSQVDSVIDIYSDYTLTATFRNMQGDPINALMQTWMNYMSSVFQGILSPYPDFLAYNIIDYQTRIWRLVMDRSKRYVQKIACTGVSVPTSPPLGSAFEYNIDTPLNPAQEQISVPFHCNGAVYNDPILPYWFNQAVEIFNPGMRDLNRGTMMHLLELGELAVFNNQACYPRIDPDSYELLWYVPIDEYDRERDAWNRHNRAMMPEAEVGDSA